jgi:hypothetical protein
MARYFFHLMDHDHVIRDENGVELQGLGAAHLYGIKLQQQILLYSPNEPCEWMVRVTEEGGSVPLIILPQRHRARAFAGRNGLNGQG